MRANDESSLKRGRILILGGVGLAVLLGIYLSATRHKNSVSASEPVQTEKSGRAAIAESIGSTGQASFSPVPYPTPVELFDSARYGSGDKEYFQRVQRHIDRLYFDSSPAKDTPEAQEILNMLAAQGVGREAVATAYNGVWMYQLYKRLWAKSPADGAVFVNGEMEKTMNELTNTYGVTNEALFKRLFEMNPTVFFGQRHDVRPPSQGEMLFE